jgi:alkanesulfonate monooxygenase SsuD/methylene tetrahydromethanopterin reductase-like flavin-dependent oxidoreductase (luciferase family)
LREAVERLRPMLAGERGLGGFHLETAPEHQIPIVLAALRARMLALAAEIADGAFTNLLPLSGARQVAQAFAAPGKELLGSFTCLPRPEEEALPTARRLFAAYATVPVYAEFFGWLGWGERLAPMLEAWQAGDRRRALELVPDDLVREIFLFGTPAQMHDRLRGFAEAGVTTFVLTPLCGPDELPGLIDALAPRR